MTRPLYTVQPTYRGTEFIVVGPRGFVNLFKGDDAFNDAYRTAEAMNAQHEKTQELAGGLIERHFGVIVDKGAA
jgi:hypothetical protein